MRKLLVLGIAAVLSGCAAVHKEDLDAWVGMPVEALDTHTFFITVPVERRMTEGGIEIRNYRNGGGGTNCITNAFATGKGPNANAFAATACSESPVCNNIFFIKSGRVLEYAPTGRCMTDRSVRPAARYSALPARKN